MLASILAFALLGASAPAADPAAECKGDPAAGLAYVCGAHHPEDLVAVPGTPWVIAAGMVRSGGDLYLIDSRTRATVSVRPGHVMAKARDRRYPCAAPPDPKNFVAHGLAIQPRGRNRATLFVVNHGAREAIEVFDVRAGARPSVGWSGCIELPEGLEANSIVPLRDGGVLFSMLFERGEPASTRMTKLFTGAPAGGVYEWHRDRELKKLAIPPLSGPNGIELSPDERWLFISGWADRTVWRIDRLGRVAPLSVSVDFLPDNLRWAPDGNLVAAGQNITVSDIYACSVRTRANPIICSSGSTAVKLDPVTMAVRARKYIAAAKEFGDATVALDRGRELWLGSRVGNRIGIADW